MVQENWNHARLIPTSGINGTEEQERRATSALLAVLASVKEFGREFTHAVGAPAGSVQAYIEVPFDLDGKRYYPDGLIHVSRGKRSWTALVEVKTGTSELTADQLESYLDIARHHDYDALITISNEIPAMVGQHPTVVDRRKLRKCSIHHVSWSEVVCMAVMQKEHKGVADSDQAWILGELIRYLEHPRSGALQFSDMGNSWVQVRDAVAAGTLRMSDTGVGETITRWDALLRFASLELGRSLGQEVTPLISRKESNDPQTRLSNLTRALTSDGVLTGQIRIPQAVGPVEVVADLRAGTVTISIDIVAPGEGRSKTRIKWLLKQLGDAPGSLRVEAYERGRREGRAELLAAARENPDLLIGDPNREIRSFRVAMASRAGAKRGRGQNSLIDSVLSSIDTFYEDVVQGLSAWKARLPVVRTPPPEESAGGPLASTALSSQDQSE